MQNICDKCSFYSPKNGLICSQAGIWRPVSVRNASKSTAIHWLGTLHARRHVACIKLLFALHGVPQKPQSPHRGFQFRLKCWLLPAILCGCCCCNFCCFLVVNRCCGIRWLCIWIGFQRCVCVWILRLGENLSVCAEICVYVYSPISKHAWKLVVMEWHRTEWNCKQFYKNSVFSGVHLGATVRIC